MPNRGRSATPEYDRNVFINCPFDIQFQPLFRAIVFAVEDCGFLARCALEVEDSGEVRVNKILSRQSRNQKKNCRSAFPTAQWLGLSDDLTIAPGGTRCTLF
jgi:hypothetical protein